MNKNNLLTVAGAMTTCGLLAAGHWFPWWQRLTRPQAYIYGTVAILLGQGVCERFSRHWLRLCLIASTGGVTVLGAYAYDHLANAHARTLAERRADGQPPRS